VLNIIAIVAGMLAIACFKAHLAHSLTSGAISAKYTYLSAIRMCRVVRQWHAVNMYGIFREKAAALSGHSTRHIFPETEASSTRHE
jgi:hypothetical protein